MTRITYTRNPLTFQGSDCPGEINTLPSLTIPDQALTIRQILDRHARGLPTSAGRYNTYDDNLDEDNPEYLPDPSKLDLVDREAYKSQITNELREIREKQRKTESGKAASADQGSL